jgi:hypothetical protein
MDSGSSVAALPAAGVSLAWFEPAGLEVLSVLQAGMVVSVRRSKPARCCE